MDRLWKAIKNLLSPPIFPGDAEKTRAARLLNTILWAGLLLIPLSLLTGLAAPLLLKGLILRLVMVLTCVVILFFTRRGYVRQSSHALVVMLWGIAAAGTYIWGGMRSTGVPLFIIPLVTAVMFLKRRAVFIILGMNIAVGLLYVWMDQAGLMPTLVDNDPFSLWVSMTLSLGWAAFTLYDVTRERDRVADEAIDENKAVLAMRQVLQERNDHLQRVVQRYIDHMVQVGAGNLTQTVPLDAAVGPGADDVGAEQADPLLLLGRQLNEMTLGLRGMIQVTRDASDNLVAASSQIHTATARQAQGISEQVSAIEGTSQMVSDVKHIAVWASQNAERMSQVTERSVDVSHEGTQSIENTIASMRQIQERVELIAANIRALTHQTQQINRILSTVNDIAAQTNMVAVNASVEAARAGQEGSGFGVVAAEVRSLADQSRQATEQIRSILADVQKGSRASVQATEQGIQGVANGIECVEQTRQVIEKLVGVIDEIAQVAVQLAAGSQQQLTSIDKASEAVQKINGIAEENQASTRETESAAENLSRLAKKLNNIIAPYQIG